MSIIDHLVPALPREWYHVALMRRTLLLSVFLAACSANERAPEIVPYTPDLARAPRLMTVAANASSVFFARTVGGGCEVVVIDHVAGAALRIRSLESCPDKMRAVGSSSIFLTFPGTTQSVWMHLDGSDVLSESTYVIAVNDRQDYAIVRNASIHLVRGSQETLLGSATGLSQFRLLPDASALIAVEEAAGERALVRLSPDGRKRVAGPFAALDSFDVSPDGDDLVFSAMRDNHDVAVISANGGEPRWIGTDAADETTVSWAPRGNKVTWVIRSFGGDILRTVHIPTAFSLLAEAGGSVGAIAWRPQAETVVVASSSPSSSDRISEMRYGGEDVTQLLAPAALSGMVLDPWPEAGSSARLALPPNPRYGEVFPLVIWVGTDARAWSDARAALWASGDTALATTARLDDAFWTAVSNSRWVDRQAVTVVSTDPTSATGSPKEFGVTLIAPEKDNDATVVRNADGTVGLRVAGAGPDVVESVAARTIALRKKRPAAADAKY